MKTTLALFCKVVDNFGDIGICWRLARQLEAKHGIAVTLWVDDLSSFKKLCHEIDTDKSVQEISHITVRHWRDQTEQFSANEVANIVIEFFGCDIPPSYIAAMANCSPRPVWLNLEGLSAEEWVEGCHTLPSSHPSYALTKYFFYPGFTNKTGGLLLESSLLQQRQAFVQNTDDVKTFLVSLGVTQTEMETTTEMKTTLVSLFCYPHAPVQELFSAWQNNKNRITCLVPEGVATDAVNAFFGQDTEVGTSKTHGALTVRIIPFLPQPDYDKLLWACDVNFVRGEDSFIRAQWSSRPFIWHIYPQDKNLHHIKLRAFLNRFTAKTGSLEALSLRWNDAENSDQNVATLWAAFEADLPKISNMSTDWQLQMLKNGDFASNLVKFAHTLR